jgi:hypothetical protein
MSGQRVYGPQNFLLELDGRPAGRLFGYEGGGIHANVITESSGHKHILGPQYEGMTVRCGTGMAQAFYDWVRNSFGGSSITKSGAVVDVGQSYQSAQRLEFHDALITSVEFPACDAGSKDAAYLTISFMPQWTRLATLDSAQHLGVYTSASPKGWHINDFKLIIDGLETDCSHVMGIDPLRLVQGVKKDVVGERREYSNVATGRDFSDLIVTLPSNSAPGFLQWLQDFVVKGVGGEKNGLVQFFTPNLTRPYFEVKLIGLGIRQMAELRHLNDQTALPAKFTMYCTEMEFNAGPAAVM